MNGEKRGYPGSSLACCGKHEGNACDHSARFVGWREKTIVSLFGPLLLLLSYYRCVKCGTSQKPWDQMLGLGRDSLTPAVSQLVSQAGVLTSFGEASDPTLKSMCGLHVSESTVQRTTESVGKRVRDLRDQAETQGPSVEWEWQRDAEGCTCAYVSLDHTGVRQQGPDAARADGKMVPVAMVYNVCSDHDDRTPPPGQVRFLSGFYDLKDIGRHLRREAEAVGIMQADRQIALSDGGSGLEDVLKTFFPNCVCILDFFHAKEHLVELAQSLYPTAESERKQWLDRWCHQLKHEGGAAVLRSLKGMDLHEQSATVQETHRRQVTYFSNHHHRMDYPTYVAKGWQIGSGPVESACKTVVGNRLKGGGMRWGEPGSDAVAMLRALYLSEPACWKKLWSAPA